MGQADGGAKPEDCIIHGNPASQTTAAVADARGSVVDCCPANVGPVGTDANMVGVTV